MSPLVAAGLLTRAQLAEALREAAPGGIAESTLAAWEKRGMPVIREGRKLRLYRLADVIAWMERKDAAA